MEAVQKYSLDAQLSTADSAAIILDVRKDLQSAIVSVIMWVAGDGGVPAGGHGFDSRLLPCLFVFFFLFLLA